MTEPDENSRPEPKIIRIDGAAVADWKAFHEISAVTFGFPDFYGKNLDAWIDCMSDLRTDSQMTKFLLGRGQMMQINLANAVSFRTNAREVFDAFVDCTAFVNQRYIESDKFPAISIVFL